MHARTLLLCFGFVFDPCSASSKYQLNLACIRNKIYKKPNSVLTCESVDHYMSPVDCRVFRHAQVPRLLVPPPLPPSKIK